MKLKSAFLLVAAAALARAALAYDGTCLVYRGRLKKPGEATLVRTSLPMTFRLYADKNAASPVWTKDMDAVDVNADGLFQVSLSGDGLSEAIGAGKANWIGVSVDGGKEQYPRQELMASAFAAKAERAGALAASPAVGTAEVRRVEAGALSVKSLSASGGISLPASSAPVRENVHITKPWKTYDIKGKVRFFKQGNPKMCGLKSTDSNGYVSFGTADCNCAAVFTAAGTDIMPGLCLLFKKGDTIDVPGSAGLPAGTSVGCLIYPIGVE